MTGGCVVREVCSVEGEEERSQDRSLRGPRAADDRVGHTVPGPHILWTVSEIVQNPVCEVMVHPGVLQLVPQKCRLYGIESTGEIQKHDSHRAPRFLQVRESPMLEEDDSVVHPDARLVGKLEWNWRKL